MCARRIFLRRSNEKLHGARAALAKVLASNTMIAQGRLSPKSDVEALMLKPDSSVPLLVGDPGMVALMRHVERVAPSSANVLIAGECGTGKQLVAAHLHRHSSHQGGAFVVLSCVATSDDLLDHELLGCDRNIASHSASEHAAGAHQGSSGTVVLNEIGEMDLQKQAKLLGILQQREADERSDRSRRWRDIRIVATTSMNLHEEVRLRRFRPTLLFRLNVLKIMIPPLRERITDIPVLAELFVKSFASTNGILIRGVSAEAMAMLLRHTWPGNVRELQNVIHRAVVMETGPFITPAALDIDMPDAPDDPDAVPLCRQTGPLIMRPSTYSQPVAVHTSGRTIDAVEKDMILDTLLQCKGNRGQTAAVLGISIRTLRNKLHEYERDGTRIPRPVIIAVA